MIIMVIIIDDDLLMFFFGKLMDLFAFMKQVRINGCANCRGGSAFDSQCSALHTIVAPSEEFPTIQALEKKRMAKSPGRSVYHYLQPLSFWYH